MLPERKYVDNKILQEHNSKLSILLYQTKSHTKYISKMYIKHRSNNNPDTMFCTDKQK